MAARTLPTMPSWSTGQEITSSLLNQITTYAQFWANPPMFKMYQATLQTTFPNNAYTQVTLDTSVWDTDSGRQSASPYSYVIPFAGRWTFAYATAWATNATGERGQGLYQNSSPVTGSQQVIPANSNINALNVSSTIDVLCNVGDVIALYGYQNSGGTMSTGNSSYLQGRLVSLASP